MKRIIVTALLMLAICSTWAQRYEDYFEDRTLRIDYTFCGNQERQQLFVDELVALPRWYGRRTRLSELPLRGCGQLTVRTAKGGTVIYRHSFSSLFQEWLSTDESKRDFKSKWEKLVKEGRAGLVEGGGYLSKGVWRGFDNCRMRTNEEPEFCLVCRQALTRLIDFYTK